MSAVSDSEHIAIITPASRRPWIAGTVSILLPGLGHVYAGKPLRGLVVWMLTVVAGVVGLAIVVAVPAWAEPPALAAIVVVLLLAVAWDAARTARRQSLAFQLRPYNRWYVYAGLLLLSAFVVQPMLLRPIKALIAAAYKLPSTSMEPTLLKGDYLLVAPLRGPVRRGQVVVYRTARGMFMKRVVGLPGDTLAMRDGQLIINGRALPEWYVRRADKDPVVPEFAWQRAYLLPGADTAAYHPSLRTWGPLMLPPKEYFILGDNRGESFDSRYTGFVPQTDLVAQPTAVYFSRGPAGAIRWTRIGHATR